MKICEIATCHFTVRSSTGTLLHKGYLDFPFFMYFGDFLNRKTRRSKCRCLRSYIGELFGFGRIHFISRETKTLGMNSEHVAAVKCGKMAGNFHARDL